MASKTDPRWTRGVGYARFSTDKQESTDEQHAINDELAAEAGIKIVARFADEAQSRSKRRRPAFLKMLAYLEQHHDVGWVVVAVTDRLTGDLAQAVAWADFAEDHDVRLKTRAGDVMPLNAAHQVNAAHEAVAAYAEVVKMRERTRSQMRAKVRAGTVAMRPCFGVRSKPLFMADGSPLPEGAVLVDEKGRRRRSGEIEVHPDEMPWVTQMFVWVGREGVSTEEVARRLMRAGVKTKTGATNWRPNTVRGILTNAFYKGELTWGAQKVVHTSRGKRLERRQPGDAGRLDLASPLGALVDPDLWQQTQDAMGGGIGARPHAKRQHNPRRPFDGMVVCGDCGLPMYGGNTNKLRKDGTRKDLWRYVCYGPRPGSKQVEGYGPPCTKGHSILEAAIIAELAKLAADPAHADVLVRYAPRDDVARERRRLTKQLQELDARFNRVREMGRNDLYSVGEVLEFKRDHDAAVAEVKAQQTALNSQATRAMRFTVSAAAALAGVVELLKERALPGDVLGAGLRDMGIKRVFIHGPRVQIEWSA
ncbi:MAG: recombinase [Frankiales bacterium]|nr:recombinase [Frankiales bacterium]